MRVSPFIWCAEHSVHFLWIQVASLFCELFVISKAMLNHISAAVRQF